MNPTELAYYAKQSRFTDPGIHASRLDDFPTDLTKLHDAIHGLLIHVEIVHPQYPHLLAQNGHAVLVRHMENLLNHITSLDSQPFNIPRPKEKQAIVDCRQFATLFCSMLRHRNIPARVRCGFATYFEDYYAGHYVCEYWHSEKKCWIIEDPDARRHNVPQDEFITGVRAWQMYRQDKIRGDLFRFGPDNGGAWAVRLNAAKDIAGLNGFETTSGDGWGVGNKPEKELTDSDQALLDRASKLASSDDHQFRALYEDSEDLRVPRVINCFDYVAQKDEKVEWQKTL